MIGGVVTKGERSRGDAELRRKSPASPRLRVKRILSKQQRYTFPMPDIHASFADYATHHQTKGNKWFHRFGIPLIMLGGLGMLARLAVAPYVDAAVLLIAVASVVYFILDWRLAALMLIASAAVYFAGAALPFWINGALFVLGWILQF